MSNLNKEIEDALAEIDVPSDREIQKETRIKKMTITKRAQSTIIAQQTKEQWKKDTTQRRSKIADSIKEKWNQPSYREYQKKCRASRIENPETCGNFKSAIIGTNIKTGKTIRFLGANQIKEAGFDPGNVYYCISGSRKKHKGYTWKRETK